MLLAFDRTITDQENFDNLQKIGTDKIGKIKMGVLKIFQLCDFISTVN